MGDLRSRQPGESIAADTIDAFDCPVCGARVTVGRTEDGDMLFHAIPACDSFVRLSDKDYVALVYRARGDAT